MKVNELTDKQQQEFTEIFYDQFWPREKTDCEDENNYPWGCPWYWNGDYELGEGSVHSIVERFYKHNEKEILKLIKEEENRYYE